MDVTSNMLEVVPTTRPGYGGFDDADGGEELAKRVENFGHPVGKSKCYIILYNPRFRQFVGLPGFNAPRRSCRPSYPHMQNSQRPGAASAMYREEGTTISTSHRFRDERTNNDV